ncbi:alpha/beta hydrolase [Actinoplanes sp. NEAU-A12]|uniref:Alpha/beta hydrolase n=1 Tax=Actinoplanes sandaracinus TaxID=3045177 RepID=A0ABT6WUD0_9ACTN|nr:alpha/beta hydrolase [Actinoplanes sandaracinus]MDI6103358.1 alpha/beta hydrolase [Actinoplanes sandaracinus]
MNATPLDDVTDEGAVVRLNGVDLFVRRFGDRALPVLVVIHGGPTWDHSYLLPAIADLVDVAHVVVFDLRGCGRSHRTPPIGDLPESHLQPDLLADDVAALIRAVTAGPADVLGFSFGGRIAMRLVQQQPGVVRRLVLASTTAYGDFDGELHGSAEYRQRRELCADISFDDPLLTGPAAPDGALSRAMAHAHAPLQVWRLDRLDAWRQVLGRVRFSSDYNRPYASGSLLPGGPDDAAAVLREWGRPVLILHGAKEMSFPVGTARRLHAALPASTLVEVPDAGHMAHFDNPSDWLAAIRRFLTRS